MSTLSQLRDRSPKQVDAILPAPPAVVRRSPWRRRTVVAYAVPVGLGAVLFLAGTSIVANETVYDDQVPGIFLAILGLVVASTADAVLLMAGRRSVVARRTRVLDAVSTAAALRRSAGAVGEAVGGVAGEGSDGGPARFVGGEGLGRFHRPDCALAVGRKWSAQGRAAHERAGRRSCGVCKP